MTVDRNDPRWWPAFAPVAGLAQGVSCSVCGALVADTYKDRGNHQLFHGLVWRLVVGDPNAINEGHERELRAWLRAVDKQ
jgi:hypothetical protein